MQSNLGQNPGQVQQVNVPAVRLPVIGLRSHDVVLKHTAKLQQNPFDAGMDLIPGEVKEIKKYPWKHEIYVHTSVQAGVGPGTVGLIVPRSSSTDKLMGGQVQLGVIDAGYTGELLVRIITIHPEETEACVGALKTCQQNGTAIAQMLILPVYVIMPFEPDRHLPKHGNRGGNGFGSTG